MYYYIILYLNKYNCKLDIITFINILFNMNIYDLLCPSIRTFYL